jgi:hypothetical protein
MPFVLRPQDPIVQPPHGVKVSSPPRSIFFKNPLECSKLESEKQKDLIKGKDVFWLIFMNTTNLVGM